MPSFLAWTLFRCQSAQEIVRYQDTVALITYLAESQKFDKLLENQQILREPIVRNGKQATVGYEPDTWKTWE